MGDTPSSTPRQYGKHERERETFFMGDVSSARPHGKHRERERERENGHKMARIFYFWLTFLANSYTHIFMAKPHPKWPDLAKKSLFTSHTRSVCQHLCL